MSALPVVAIVGRPNVGKSTLVNRFVGRREAIVEERPGVTRDRKALDAEWNGRRFTVVDTGGWIATDEPLARQVSLQAERAIRESDLILMVVDVTVAVTEEDAAIVATINALRPDYVWVGLGAPKQDLWVASHRDRLLAPALLAVGAAFDFHAGRKRRAPRWMQRTGTEWIFRLLSEPRRLAGRYTRTNIAFVRLVLAERRRRGAGA